jgi:hypothetical protein
MTRQPDPNSKSSRVVLVAKPGQEQTVKSFKELCRRDHIEVNEALIGLVQEFLQRHNYPPGNPQLQLTQYDGLKGFEPSKRGPQYDCNSYRGFGVGKPYCNRANISPFKETDLCRECDASREVSHR